MMKIHQNAIARRKPMGQKKSRRTMYRPRDCGGRNSESRDGSTTSIPPRPSPASRRNPNTLHGSQATAVRAVKTEYQRMLARKTVRRPRSSATRPRVRLPMNDPTNVAEVTREYSSGFDLGVRPNSVKIAGKTKPIRMISKATKVQANPINRTTRRWNEVNPPARKTSSTERVAVATESRRARRYLRIRGTPCLQRNGQR